MVLVNYDEQFLSIREIEAWVLQMSAKGGSTVLARVIVYLAISCVTSSKAVHVTLLKLLFGVG